MADASIGALSGGLAAFSSGGGVLKFLAFFAIILLVLILLAVFIGIKLYKRKFNHTAVIFEKIRGKFVPVHRWKAMKYFIDKTGDHILLTNKKSFLPRPRKLMDKETSWWFKRKDGELINFDLDDFDEAMAKAKCTFVREDVRLLRTAVYRNLRNEFHKPKFMEKYGHLVMAVGVIMIIILAGIILLYYTNKSVNEIAEASAGSAENLQRTAESFERIAKSLDNVVSRLDGGALEAIFVPLLPFGYRRRKRCLS